MLARRIYTDLLVKFQKMPVLQVPEEALNMASAILLELIPNLEIRLKPLSILKKIFSQLKKLLEPSSKACLDKL